MSDPIRIALVAEGVTDYVVVHAAIAAMLPAHEFELRLLQPEYSEAFEPVGSGLGLGWSGVYRWCRQTSAEGGDSIRSSVLFGFYDLLLIHLDADVAGYLYSSGRISDTTEDLPCERPCPPASATTDPLREVLLRWIGERELPPRCVLCTPSKNTETWVMATLFPHNKVMVKQGWECYADPEAQLALQPKGKRLQKSRSSYEERAADFTSRWSDLCGKLSEAERFDRDFRRQAFGLRLMTSSPD